MYITHIGGQHTGTLLVFPSVKASSFRKVAKSPWQMSEMRPPKAQEGTESIICLAGLLQDVGMCTVRRCGSLIKHCILS